MAKHLGNAILLLLLADEGLHVESCDVAQPASAKPREEMPSGHVTVDFLRCSVPLGENLLREMTIPEVFECDSRLRALFSTVDTAQYVFSCPPSRFLTIKRAEHD